MPVQGLFVVLLLPNFLLLVYLSLLSWRITRGAWWNAPFDPTTPVPSEDAWRNLRASCLATPRQTHRFRHFSQD